MEMLQNITDVYKPRNPQASDYFKCTQDIFEELEMVWGDRYERQCGFWRPYVKDVLIITDLGEGYDTLSKMLKSKDSATNFHGTEIDSTVPQDIGNRYTL